MTETVSYIDALNFIERRGYDIQVIKKENYFIVGVWHGDKFLGEGKIVYKNWKDALRQTTLDFYEKLKK